MIVTAKWKHQLLSHFVAVLLSAARSPTAYPSGEILGAGGLPQGVLERAALEEMLTGHWSGVAGVHFRQSYFHLGEQLCVQPVVPGSQLQAW